VVAPARIEPFDLTYNLVATGSGHCHAPTRRVPGQPSHSPLSWTQTRKLAGLPFEQAIARKFDRVGAHRHRPALISPRCPSETNSFKADGGSVGLIDELKVTLDTTQAGLHPLCGEAETGYRLYWPLPLPFPLPEAARCITCNHPAAGLQLCADTHWYLGSVTSRISKPLSVQPV